MKVWTQRAKDEAFLLNPAFCCTVISTAVSNFVDTSTNGMPLPIAFMVLPILLHKPTRDRLPANTRTSMPAWLQENASARVLFYERLISLKPHTREAIQFGMHRNWIS